MLVIYTLVFGMESIKHSQVGSAWTLELYFIPE